MELASGRQSYRDLEINGYGLVRGADNPTERLTKAGANGALGRLLGLQVDRTFVVEWVKRAMREQNTSN